MLAIDASNLVHSGDYKSRATFLDANQERFIKGIPYLFQKISNFAIKSERVFFAFDPDPDDMGAGSKVFATARTRSPQVVWELRVLKRLLHEFGIPMAVRNGFKADSLIHSALEDNDHIPENHYMVTNDQDMACDVKIRGEYINAMLGFSSQGYYVDPKLFYPIYGIPYNWMNFDKMFSGCPSDAIPVGTDGTALKKQFYDYMQLLLDIEHGSATLAEFSTVFDVFEYNTEEYFFKWLTEEADRSDLITEYKIRANAIFPKYTPIGVIPQIDWEVFNGLISHLTQNSDCLYKKYAVKPLTTSQKDFVEHVVYSTAYVKANVFTPTSSEVLGIESGVLDDLDVFSKGGEDL